MRKIFVYSLLFILVFSCEKEKYKSDKANVLGVKTLSTNVEGLKIDTTIVIEDKQIVFLLPNKHIPAETEQVTIDVEFIVSKNAEASKKTQKLTFSSPSDSYTITVNAENGDVKNWKIFFSGNQLPFADFENWQDVSENGMQYRDLIDDDSIFWNTSNSLSSKIKYAGVTRFPEGNSKQAKITTGENSTYPILTSAVFSGTLLSDIKNIYPNNLVPKTTTGIPYSLKPKQLRLKYKYSPGKKYIQATPNNTDKLIEGFTIKEIEGVDKCRIIAMLVHKIGTQIVEVGRAELISPVYRATLLPYSIPFSYKLNLTPTHIIFFATASAEGHKFKGAVGSSLVIDDIEFVF